MYTVDVEYELVNPELQCLEKLNLSHCFHNKEKCYKHIEHITEKYKPLLVGYEIIREYECETA